MRWAARLSERFLGYVPAGSWRLYPIEARHRRRFSLPVHVPVPREVWSQWPAGTRPERLSHGELAAFAARFLESHPGHWAADGLRRFAAKADLALRVESSLRQGEWAAAADLLEQILTQDPGDGRAHFLLALCHLGRGRMAEAAVELQAAESQMRIDADFQVARGRVAEHREDLETAREAYRTALSLQEGHPTALERLAALGELVEIYLGDLDQPEKAYLTQEDYAEFIEKGWESEPQTPQFYLERSRFHLISGQPALALRAAERGAALRRPAEPSNGTAPDLAAPEASEVIDLDLLEARARALLALERFSEAETPVARLEQLAPESAAALSQRGQLLWFTGRREGAAPLIRRALQRDPNRPENVRLYLDPDFPREETSLATALDQLVRRFPQSWAVQWIRSSLAMASGDWETGEQAARAAAAAGASEEALLELSGRLGRAGRYDAVVDLCTAAGGWGRFREAHPMLRGNLAGALARAGHVEAARHLWQSLLNDGSAHPELRLRAREALRSESGVLAPDGAR
ncbi:MAG: tetratricopeptide repeat protein [Candidatus Eisenbacteria bacterium]|nr:tetratricopeptide repeat protein [Candidatus Eisenbacteria bacterium]